MSRLYGIIIMSLILIFSFIHLGVSIGIITRNHPYGDIFRPEIGLSAYNIVISFLGIVVGAIGLVCVLTEQKVLSKVVALIAVVLGIFALVSVVTAIIINSKSTSYVSTRFFNDMNRYITHSDAREIIDRIQTKYKCCGETTWLDWARVQSGTTTGSTTTSTTTISTVSAATTTTNASQTTSTVSAATTTTNASQTTSTVPSEITTAIPSETTSTVPSETTSTVPSGTTSTIPVETTNIISVETTSTIPVETTNIISIETTNTVPAETTTTPATDTTTTPTVDTTTTPAADTAPIPSNETTTISSRMRANVRKEINFANLLSNFPVFFSRPKRQTVSTSNNIISISYSNQISVPASCCINGASSSNNSSQSTCSSSSQLYTNGCLRSLVNRANEQDMGIGIINCFMIVLAFTAMTFLLHGSPDVDSLGRNLYVQQFENIRQFDSNPHNNYPSIVNTFH